MNHFSSENLLPKSKPRPSEWVTSPSESEGIKGTASGCVTYLHNFRKEVRVEKI